ncbi:a1-alpha2 repression [Chytridiales sp. JEL 0842]|nr:a1-alpha2 repression [Chytridiales sp. JEL 0842]
MNIDQETARALLRQGAFLLFMDAPPNLDFGIDCNEWNTGPKFKGLKLIPPGFHFFYYSARGKTGETAVRTGFFKYFESREIVVKKWNAADEDVYDDAQLDQGDVDRLKHNILQFDQYLGAYPLIPTESQPINTYQRWLQLVSYITSDLAARILPKSGKVSAITSVSRFSDVPPPTPRNTKNNSDMSIDSQQPPLEDSPEAKAALEELKLSFTPLDLRRSFPPQATAAEVTKYSLDKTYLLNKTIEEAYGGSYKLLLGELQLSFVLFLVGQIFDGLEQWKTLIKLVCGSSEALQTLAGTLFYDFLGVLQSQLDNCPEDFFMDALSSESFLRESLVQLVANVKDLEVVEENKKLMKRVDLMIMGLSKRFKWDILEEVRRLAESSLDVDLDGDDGGRRTGNEFAPVLVEMDEDDEYAPVVVELPADDDS